MSSRLALNLPQKLQITEPGLPYLRSQVEHTQAYIICATPRSGTTLLTDLLTDTGVAGRPDSFFRLQSMRSWWAQQFGVSVAEWTDEHAFDHAYLAAVLQEGTGELSFLA